MIHYKCDACLTDLEAETTMSGKPVQCYKCKNVQSVPLPDFGPRLSCPYCEEHEWNDLTKDQEGTMVKCPKCQHMVRVPGEGKGCSFTAAILVFAGLTLTILYGWMR